MKKIILSLAALPLLMAVSCNKQEQAAPAITHGLLNISSTAAHHSAMRDGGDKPVSHFDKLLGDCTGYPIECLPGVTIHGTTGGDLIWEIMKWVMSSQPSPSMMHVHEPGSDNDSVRPEILEALRGFSNEEINSMSDNQIVGALFGISEGLVQKLSSGGYDVAALDKGNGRVLYLIGKKGSDIEHHPELVFQLQFTDN